MITQTQQTRLLVVSLTFVISLAASRTLGADLEPRNLARAARATAFESYQGMTPDLANDGNMETRWSGIPGHNTGGWYELDWERPVRIAEVIIFQHDRYVTEMDLQVWDEQRQNWVTLQHLGDPNSRLPRIVDCQVNAVQTRRLRLGNIMNGPSFSEVQVFEEAVSHTPVVSLASDDDGHFIGMLSDEWGSAAVTGAEISLSGQAAQGAWRATGHSDAHGLFAIPMPLGLTGEVTIGTRLPAGNAPRLPAQHADGARFQYGLTPANLAHRNISLDGVWKFKPDPPEDFWRPDFKDAAWADIQVPGHFVMQGFQSAEGAGGYLRQFHTPPGKGRLKLRFDGVYSGAEVWVNGHRLAYHEGGALPFEADITEVVNARDNLLAIRVTEHTPVSDRLDKMSEYADFPLTGIIRSVSLFRVPAVHIGKLALSTVFDEAFRDAQISLHIAVLNESSKGLTDGTLTFRLLDPDGRPAPSATRPVAVETPAWRRTELALSIPVAAPAHWEAEHPRLYTLEATLLGDGRELERVVQKIGFRQTDIRNRQLLINGQPVKLRGTCHHDSHPLLGRAVTAELTRQDLELMKEANLNALRTSHYPPLPALLDIADELGIYVEDEGSFCWVDSADDLRLTPRIMQLNAELLARDRNHPSVFIWSLCNESEFGYGFERSHEWMRAADPSRPNAGSYDRGSLEILARHNPITVAGIAELEKSGKPVLWDESWCIFQGIWGDVAEMWLDPGIRDYYAQPLGTIYEHMMRNPTIAGSQIWAWSDDIFCVPNRGLEYGRQTTPSHFIENQYRLPNRGLVGDAPWGVVDAWRRKKPEFWITWKLHSPVKLKEAPIVVPATGAPIRLPVENQYDFTDLSELKWEWQLGREHGVARTAAAPHQHGEIEMKPTLPIAPGQSLSLQIKDPKGCLVDAYDLPFGEPIHRLPALHTPAPVPLRIVRENYLAGKGTRVVGKDFELGFDEASGGLRRTVVFGQPLLLELPRLHVLPAATPFSALPNVLSWQLQRLDISPEGSNVRIKISGSYEHFEGGYDLLVTPEGAITLHSSFKYTGEKIFVRELGLAWSVPLDCDLLRWQRRAEWSVYPSDHIGRPSGEVRAFAKHEDRLPPTWSWGADNSPMGCNDFRSTKRNIDWASISYPAGPGVWVESTGSQHARATVESDRIAFHLSDWYGGTHAGLWEWTSNYGEGKLLTPGDTLESAAYLRLGQIKGPQPHHFRAAP